MTTLKTTPNIDDPDGFYAELLDLHAGIDRAASEALNARLVLVLANHIGDRDLLRQAFAAAKATGGDSISPQGRTTS
ncbi:MAG: DUF2783 domain-containing protein [Geminicoccaceae bacterium]